MIKVPVSLNCGRCEEYSSFNLSIAPDEAAVIISDGQMEIPCVCKVCDAEAAIEVKYISGVFFTGTEQKVEVEDELAQHGYSIDTDPLFADADFMRL